MAATSLMRTTLLGYWRQARPWQRLGYLVGGALILAGLGHLVAWLVVGGAWAGPVSFRKPTTFGISFGLTTLTLAWIAGQLRISDRTGWLLLVPLAAADTFEVVWVSVQRWRGVASISTSTPHWTPRCSCWAGSRSRSRPWRSWS
jgi:hypothetical protein